MIELHPPFSTIWRRMGAASIVINILGALVTFLYFDVIAPLPIGQAAVRMVNWYEIGVAGLLLGVPLAAGWAWGRRQDAQLLAWARRLLTGDPAAAVPPRVRRDALLVPVRTTVLSAVSWVFVGACIGVLSRSFSVFAVCVGFGGLLATVLLYFVNDLIWRPAIPLFFPDGDLRSVRAFRLPVLGRLLIVFLLVGILPPALLASLSWQRAQMLLVTPNPQAVLDNLLVLQVFVVLSSMLVSVALALFMTRSITGPLDRLQQAMKRVERSEFDVRVPVTGDDELGYLTAGFNDMAAGLQERERIKEAHRKVEQELAVAWTIQQSFLPAEVPQLAGWQLAASLEPARQTSGDFYDWISLPDGRLGLLVADVADKGTGAALYMALSRTLIRTYAVEYPAQPAQALAAANRRLRMDSQATMFVTVFYAVLDPAAGDLTYCSAGHNPAFLVPSRPDCEIQALGNTGMPLGIFEGAEWGQATAHLAPGDLLAVYSDGITDAEDGASDFYGKERLLAALETRRGRPADQVREAVLAEVRRFAGDSPQFDDMTLMLVARDPAG